MCLVVFVCCFWPSSWGTPRLPVVGVVVFVFDASFWCLFVRSDFSDSNSLGSLWVGLFLFGEFDSGSGRTLAACLTHASRTVRPFRGYTSGERVSNTWVICPALRDKLGKLGLIPDRTIVCMDGGGKLLRCGMGPRPISLLVG